MIGVVGLSYKSATVDVREQIALSPELVPSFLSVLADDYDIQEAVVLSTCNRTEVYFHSPGNCLARDAKAITDALCKLRGGKDGSRSALVFPGPP